MIIVDKLRPFFCPYSGLFPAFGAVFSRARATEDGVEKQCELRPKVDQLCTP
jgi:hypothetical protein